MKISDYAGLDGVAISRLVKTSEVSQYEVVEAAIETIEALNPQLNALVMKNYEVAREAARTADTEKILSGVPFLLKDVNVYSQDMPTTFSCRFFEDAQPQPDSEIVKRWRHSGLLVLGKSNTPEFAEDYVCEPTFRGPALNPWNPKVTTGGSSGGAAAAVASGMVPIAHGTDLGGSIRIPAACCGIYGLKPTSGLCPVDYSRQELSSGLNSDHVLTRSVRDSARVLDATAYPLLGSLYPITRSVPSYFECLEQPLKPLKIGFCSSTPFGTSTPARQQAAVDLTVNLLADQGHELEEYEFPTDLQLDESLGTLWMFDAMDDLERRIQQSRREPEHHELEAMTHFMRSHVASLSAMDHHRARILMHQNSVRLMGSMSHFDLLLTPALGKDPEPVGTFDSRTDEFDYEKWCRQGDEFAPFSSICNYTGQPAASIPVFLPGEAFPCAVQLAGHSGQDHIVLQASALLENQTRWSQFQPPVWAGDC